MIPNLNKTVTDIPAALSIFVNQIVYDKRSRGERVYTYSLGEAFFDIPRFEITDADWYAGYHYCASMGQIALRRKIAELYADKYDARVNPTNQILVSAGSKPIIFMLMQTVLNPGDEVIVPEPAWLSYKEQIKLAGGVHVGVPYDVDVYEWEKYITPRTKMIVINNPNNPSGRLYSRAELEYLLGLAQKHSLFILSDEAYSDFLIGTDKFTSFAAVDKTQEHCLVVNSLSKNMGMSGWRVGYAIAHADVIAQLLKLNQHLITCAPTVLQDYMAKNFDEILTHTVPQARQMAEKRAVVQNILNELGIRALGGCGTFYFLLDISDFPGTTDELVYDLLLNHNIATVPGGAYGASTHKFIRFGIGVEDVDTIRHSLGIIKDFLNLTTYDNTKITEQMKQWGIK